MLKKSNLLILMLVVLLIIPFSFAEDNETVTDVNNITDYYFDVNASIDGDGLKDTPFKNFTSDRVKDNSTIHLAGGEYVFNEKRQFTNITFNG